jgi:hypothetical protein
MVLGSTFCWVGEELNVEIANKTCGQFHDQRKVNIRDLNIPKKRLKNIIGYAKKNVRMSKAPDNQAIAAMAT